VAWFESFLRDRGIAGDPPPKKSSTLLGPLTELNDRLARLPFFQKAAEEARDFVHNAKAHPWETYVGMVGPGELGSLAERKVAQAALRFHVPGEAEPRQFTGPSHAIARLDAEDALGDLLDQNFEPRFKEESGFVDNLGNWLDRAEAKDLAKKNKQLGGNPKAVEAVNRSGQLKSEALRQPDVYTPSNELQGLIGKDHNPDVLRVVEGLVRNNPMPRVTAIDAEKAQQMAKVYESLPKNDPAAKSAYDALNKEVASQLKAIKGAGYKIEYVKTDPYANSAEMMKDVRENKRLKVFATPDDSFHPYMTPAQNNAFRAVHDWIAHAGPGNQFGPIGEENAYRMHAATLSPEAQRALATETRGQNSWVNFGPNSHLPVKERPFAEQKAALWPAELTGDYETMPTPVARSLEQSPASQAVEAARGFGLGGHIPEQKQLEYFRGPRTDPNQIAEAYEISRKAFRPTGPYKKYLKAGGEYPSAAPWYTSTRGIYRDAADVIGPEKAAVKIDALLGKYMPSVTARSAPPSNLKRAFLWQQLIDQGLITPEQLDNSTITLPPGFGHFAQSGAHQKTLARTLRAGAVDPIANPKPASFGANLTGNELPGTFDTVMGRILRAIDPKSSKFFKKTTEDTAPHMWAYQPFERGLADAAQDAANRGLLDLEPGIAPTGAYQSLGWHGATGSAEYGSMYDIWNRFRDQSADLWGVSPAKANEMIWGEGRVPLLPLDSPLLMGVKPRSK
jgi:hypothetical protein